MRDKLENVSYETIPLLRPFWIGKEKTWEPSVSYEIISAFYPLDEKNVSIKNGSRSMRFIFDEDGFRNVRQFRAENVGR